MMQTGEGIHQRDDERVGGLGVQALLASAACSTEKSMLDAVEGLAVQELHRDVVLIVDGADLVRLDDVRVIQPRRDASFLEEHRDELGILGEILPQPLDDGELTKS